MSRAFLLALAIGIVPASAVAQSTMGSSPESGSLIKRNSASVDGSTPTDARRTTRQFATCTVQRSRHRAEEVVLMPVSSDDFFKKLNRLADDECLSSGVLTLPWNVIRTSLFEALYVVQYGRKGPIDFSEVVPINYLDGYPAELSVLARTTVALARFGDCVSRKDGANARLLVTSLPGGDVETQALKALSPEFNGCVLQGEKLTFSRSIIRGAVGEGMYRLSRSASPIQ